MVNPSVAKKLDDNLVLIKYHMGSDADDFIEKAGFSPAMMAAALFTAMTGEEIKYAEIRPLNVYETEALDSAIKQVSNSMWLG